MKFKHCINGKPKKMTFADLISICLDNNIVLEFEKSHKDGVVSIKTEKRYPDGLNEIHRFLFEIKELNEPYFFDVIYNRIKVNLL